MVMDVEKDCEDALILSAEKLEGKKKKKNRMGDGSTVWRAVERCTVCCHSIFRLIT